MSSKKYSSWRSLFYQSEENLNFCIENIGDDNFYKRVVVQKKSTKCLPLSNTSRVLFVCFDISKLLLYCVLFLISDALLLQYPSNNTDKTQH